MHTGQRGKMTEGSLVPDLLYGTSGRIVEQYPVAPNRLVPCYKFSQWRISRMILALKLDNFAPQAAPVGLRRGLPVEYVVIITASSTTKRSLAAIFTRSLVSGIGREMEK